MFNNSSSVGEASITISSAEYTVVFKAQVKREESFTPINLYSPFIAHVLVQPVAALPAGTPRKSKKCF